MPTRKKNAASPRQAKTKTRPGRNDEQCKRMFDLQALLMVGHEAITIDIEDNDSTHFMAEFIDVLC
jgi:hypothetical protein